MTVPPLPDRTILGAAPGDWIAALLAIVITVAAIYVARRLLTTRFATLAERTRTVADDAVVHLLRRTPIYITVFAATRVLAETVALPPRVARPMRAIGMLALFVQLGVWTGTAISFWAERVVRDRAQLGEAPGGGTVRALAFGLHLLLWSALLLVALDTFDVDVTALIAGLGIGGIAVALAAQQILGDLFAALAIVLDKPFIVGDTIQVDQFMGTVQHVGVKTTRVRGLDGEEIIFPNSNLLQSRIRNYRRMVERRAVLGIGVAHETPRELLARVPAMLREVITGQDQTRFDRAHLDRLDDEAVRFEAVYFVLTPDYNVHMDIKQAIWLQVVERFREQGIEFAQPSRKVLVRRGGAAEPADRRGA